jgi:hypothetical protein
MFANSWVQKNNEWIADYTYKERKYRIRIAASGSPMTTKEEAQWWVEHASAKSTKAEYYLPQASTYDHGDGFVIVTINRID